MSKIEEIKARLAEVAHKDSVDGSLKLRELGIDSLDIVELLLQLEEDYGVHFDDMDMSTLVTVQDLLDEVSLRSRSIAFCNFSSMVSELAFTF